MRCLLIDDIRTPDMVSLEEDVQIARTYDQGIECLREGNWDILYLDHDLGDPDERKTGYGIMCFLEQNIDLLPKEIVLVTANPVGRKNMQAVIFLLYGKE